MILFIDIITIKCEKLKNRHNQIVTQLPMLFLGFLNGISLIISD